MHEIVSLEELLMQYQSRITHHSFICVFFLPEESVMKSGDKSDKTQVLFLSKLKLMDWERTPGRSPELLSRPEVEMVTGTSV
jgi:hypothetical protein